MATLTALPDSFPAGTTVKYTRTVSDYPASGGWTLKLMLAGPATLSVTAAASGADHVVTVTAAQSAALAAGVYRWAEEVSKDAEVYRVADGTVTVNPNMNTAQPGDLQSQDEKLLAAVNAMIAVRTGASGSAPKDIEAYSIDGVTITKVPLEQLYRLRTSLGIAVARAKRGGGFGRQHRVAFTGASQE